MNGTISGLPDELLLEILSLLPTKCAVATSVLSKRWRSLWKEVKMCRYDGEFDVFTSLKFKSFICTRSIVERLDLRLNPNYLDVFITPVVNVAVNHFLKELRIEMVYNSFKLPKSLYICSHLETLVLKKLSLVDVPSNVLLSCLKSLHLLSVNFAADESVERLLNICPSLEDLVVKRSSYTKVMIFVIRVPTLKSLSIDYSSCKCRPSGSHGFVINAPSLRHFSIRDSFSNYLRFGNMPQLVKANVNVVCDQPDKFLGSLTSTQYLSLSCFTSQLQTPYPRTGTCFKFLNHLELYSCWWNLLTFILNHAVRLRVLKLKLYKDPTDPWNQPNSVPECLSSHLEILEWRQYKGSEQEREAAKYILENASHLKKATFYLESTEEHEMLNKELECVVTSSKTCQLLFQ